MTCASAVGLVVNYLVANEIDVPFDSRTAHVVHPPLLVMASNASSGVYFSLLDHANGLYACSQTLINDNERIQGYFVKSAVEAHLCICETELDSQNPEIDMLDQMGIE